jgi:uncharacterized membrane protein YGL010W
MDTKLNHLLNHYSESHQNPKNQKIHKVAVPLIMFSLLGLLHQLSWSYLNAAWTLVFFASVYYLQFKSLRVFLAAYLQVVPMMVLILINPLPAVPFYLGVFILAWIAQFIGHNIEGKRPSFLQDLQYLLIGPLWVSKGILK